MISILDQNIKIEISSSSIAWYAAIVSTVGIMISFFNYFRDRSKIKIKYKTDVQLINVEHYDEDKKYLDISVINLGRRPIKLGNVALKMLGKRGYTLLSDSLLNSQGQARVLTEENPITDYFAESYFVDFGKVLFIAVYDATGRRYIRYISLFPTFKRILYFINNLFKIRK